MVQSNINLAIIVHENDSFDNFSYYLRSIANVWKENGINVIITSSKKDIINVDIGFLHVDLSIIPLEYQKLVERIPIVINRNITNITKRFVSKNLVGKNDLYQGPVIVKTNMNCGGYKESCLNINDSILTKSLNYFRNRLPWSFRSELYTCGYKIFDSIKSVPLVVWYNKSLVVEKFLPEQSKNGEYCVRNWVFLGDQETNAINYSLHPIAKLSHIIRREIDPIVPDQLREIRRKFGIDYGKIDYVIRNGEVILYDINPTPTVGKLDLQIVLKNSSILAKGLDKFL